MRTFSFPAAYRRVVESSIALALADIARAEQYREDEDHRVRELSPVPEPMIDLDAHGTLTVFIVDTEPNGKEGKTLHAIAKAAATSHT